MKNILFHLSSCDTCRRIIKEVDFPSDVVLHDIKTDAIDAVTLDYAQSKVGSYEALFNKRAQKYRSLGIKDQNPSESDYRRLILDEYTFLKRPLAVIDGEVYTGNSKKTIAELKNKIHG